MIKFRYTETRVYGYLKKLFPMEDIIATKAFRTVDGLPAEPLTLMPIVPLGVINGQSQSAVGFSTNLLPRNPIEIIDLFLDLLTQLMPPIVQIIQALLPVFVQIIGELLPPFLQIVQAVLPLLLNL